MSKVKKPINRLRDSSVSEAAVPGDYSFLFESPCEFICAEDSSIEGTLSENSQPAVSITDNTEPVKTAPEFNVSDIPSDTRLLSLMGVTLGSGKIVSKISSSGNSRIYKIWIEDLEMFRAVKICTTTDTMHDAMNRFLTEAKIAAQLRHPNIIEVYSLGKWKNIPYIEMEYIDGYSVGQIIKLNGPLPLSVACAISIYTCKALLFAHQHEFMLGGKTYHGIIHRDLKPYNIMISNNGVVKLLDFGIARPCDESLYQTVASDKVVGTIQYLSPEQMDGSELDFRTDIYSFGIVLYEMLTGIATFPQTTLSNIVKAKIMNSYSSFSELNIQVPPGLENIVNTCIEFRRENRFPSLVDLLNALEEFFSREFGGSCDDVVKTYLANTKLNQASQN